jgi:hypothetical protein
MIARGSATTSHARKKTRAFIVVSSRVVRLRPPDEGREQHEEPIHVASYQPNQHQGQYKIAKVPSPATAAVAAFRQ